MRKLVVDIAYLLFTVGCIAVMLYGVYIIACVGKPWIGLLVWFLGITMCPSYKDANDGTVD